MNANEKLTKARTRLVLDHPFFGSLALRLVLKEDPSVQSAYTNGVVLGFNAGFIQGLNMEETIWLVAHEVMHLACLHHTRRDDRQPSRWNVAADHAINGLLAEAGFKAPAGCLLDERFEGKSAEAIYELLADPGGHEDKPGSDPSSGNPNPGDPSPDGLSNQPGEVRDLPDIETNRKQAEAQWRVHVAQAAQQSRAMGSMPVGVERLIEQVLYPKVDWCTLLRHFVETASRNDYCWLPPSRRYLSRGIWLPSLHAKEPGSIVIAVDTSASIDPVALAQFGAEVSAVLEVYDTMIDVVYCDTEIQGHGQYTRQDLPLELAPAGFGGTDYRPVFEFVDKEGIVPRCLVYMTDLECHRFPEKTPNYPVLWVQNGHHPGSVPFGETVQMG